MKPHRIFIAINLPEDAKEKLLAYQERWPEVPARWTTKENLHLTLAFLGNTSDQELAEVCKLIKEVGERHQPFSIECTGITYWPPRKAPRIICGIMRRSPKLSALREDMETALAHSNKIHYQPEKQPFSPHLTLARLRTFELQRMELEELPDVNEEISISFQVKSIEVMESALRRSGAEYSVIQSFMLKR